MWAIYYNSWTSTDTLSTKLHCLNFYLVLSVTGSHPEHHVTFACHVLLISLGCAVFQTSHFWWLDRLEECWPGVCTLPHGWGLPEVFSPGQMGEIVLSSHCIPGTSCQHYYNGRSRPCSSGQKGVRDVSHCFSLSLSMLSSSEGGHYSETTLKEWGVGLPTLRSEFLQKLLGMFLAGRRGPLPSLRLCSAI